MKISNNVYMLKSSKGSCVYVIKGKETILIDTGLPIRGNKIEKELKDMNLKLNKIKHIFLTHHDIDHIGNAYRLQQLTGAKVWASKEDIPYITGKADRHSFKKYFKHIFKVKAPENIQPYTPGQKINGIEIVPTPGHTPGHVCLLYRDILFAGDLIKNKNGKLVSYPSAWNWDHKKMSESINKVSRMYYKWLCPAHGKPVRIKDYMVNH